MQTYSVAKLFRNHNPDLSLPTQGLQEQTQRRKTHMPEEQTQQPTMADILALFQGLNTKLDSLQKRPRKTRTANPKRNGMHKAIKGKKGPGGVLEWYRHEKGWTQRELGQRIGSVGATISLIENRDDSNVGIKVLGKVAAALEIKLSDLILKMEQLDAAQ